MGLSRPLACGLDTGTTITTAAVAAVLAAALAGRVGRLQASELYHERRDGGAAV